MTRRYGPLFLKYSSNDSSPSASSIFCSIKLISKALAYFFSLQSAGLLRGGGVSVHALGVGVCFLNPGHY